MVDFIWILIIIYMSINLFSCGYYYANDFKYENKLNDRLLSGFWLLLMFLFGTVIFIVIGIYGIIRGIVTIINETFQINFLFNFYFTKKWNDLDEDKVKDITDFANKKDKKKLKNRIYIHCVDLLNKRLQKNKNLKTV